MLTTPLDPPLHKNLFGPSSRPLESENAAQLFCLTTTAKPAQIITIFSMSPTPLTKELSRFLKPYDRSIVAIATAARSFLFAEAPTATELVYDAYNAVADGLLVYGPAQRRVLPP